MRVSLNTIKQFIDFELPPLAELVTIINAQLGGVEEVIDLNQKYQDVVIVKVISCIKHDNADKLSVCLVDDGGVVKDLERNENGFVQVVCGAPNVHDGMFAAWLPPKSTVPASSDDKEPFVLEAREIRGVISNGMLAAADELAIGTNHDGILELNPDEWRPYEIPIEPGVSFAKAYGLDDTIIDIENKMFTHRPDLFGQLGVAREIAGILGHPFKSPDWYTKQPVFEKGEGLELTVLNETSDKVPRFMAVAIKDIEVKPSPLWLQCALTAMGAKPINNIVDVTNYVMLLTAQPTHAYDYDKLRGHKLGARMAKTGEQLPLLNGKTYTLETDDIVIVDGEGPVGLGGIMGGGNSEVSADTKNIVLEVANFDMYTVRKSSMHHGLFTDALTRFNKGQSPLQNAVCLDLAVQSIFDTAGGKLASQVFDQKRSEDAVQMGFPMGGPEEIEVSFINTRLGLQLSLEEIVLLLNNVNFHCYEKTGATQPTLFYWAPFWRMDIQDPEDIVEEVGRLYGFDKLPRELPKRSISPTTKNTSREAKQKIRSSLANSGLNEVLTYSFVHENTMISAEQSVDQAFRISNAISPDLQYYRLSVLPSLLDKVHMNIKSGYDEFGLFEIGKGHNKKYHANDDAGLPLELEFVDIIYANKTSRKDAPFFQIRRIVDQLAIDLGFELKFLPIKDNLDFPVTAPFEQSRSAMVESLDGEFIGMIGELKQSVIKNFKLPAYSATATLGFDGIKKAAQKKSKEYNVLSRFPSISYDLSLRGSSTLAYADVFASVKEAFSDTVGKNVKFTIMPTSIYQANEASETNTTTFHIVFKNNEKTLTVDEAKLMVKAAVDIVVGKLDLQLV